MMHAGLTEGAVQLLLRLQVQIANLLGGPEAAYDPTRFTADPAPVVAVVSMFDQAMRARHCLQRRMRWLLRLGPIMCLASIIYLAGWLSASCYFVNAYDRKWLRDAGLSVLAVGVVGGLLMMALYVHLTMRLSATEILSYDITHPLDPGDRTVVPDSEREAGDG
jgi:uncharacterized membrane protein